MIEDIEYLKENCEKDSATFYIDTSQRNKNYYPTPSEFCIDFEQPFRFVNGFDVLDAAIPTTMYNIDEAERDIAITVVNGTTPRDSFKELSDSQIFSAIFEYKLDETKVFVCDPSVLTKMQGILDPLTDDVVKTLILQDTKVPYKYFMAIRKHIDDLPFTAVGKEINSTLFFITINNQLYAIDGDHGIVEIIKQKN